MTSPTTAIVLGITGIAGRAIAERLGGDGWRVVGVSRRRPDDLPRVDHVAVDLLDAAATRSALQEVADEHLSFTTWSRNATEQQNCRVNGAMLSNALDGAELTARQTVELGSSEIAQAEQCKRHRRSRCRILYVTDAQFPDRARLFVLPNPRSAEGLSSFTDPRGPLQ